MNLESDVISELPVEILDLIYDFCDEETLMSLSLTCHRNLEILTGEQKHLFRMAKKRIGEKLKNLNLSEKFKALEGIKTVDEIENPVDYGMSGNGYKHTFECLNHMENLKTQFESELDTELSKDSFYCKQMIAKLLLCVLLISISFIFLELCIVCFAGASDMSEKYPQGKIRSQSFSMLSSSSLSMLSSSSPVFSSFIELAGTEHLEQKVFEMEKKKDGNEIDLVQVKDEGNMNAGVESESATLLFLWHYCSAAVCFIIFLLFAIVPQNILSYGNPQKSTCELWWSLLLLPLLLPALGMDGFLPASYWILFIPEWLAVLLMICGKLMATGCCGRCFHPGDDNDPHPRCTVYGGGACFHVSSLLSSAGLVLYILKLEGNLPESFLYTYIFLLPTMALALNFAYYLIVSGGEASWVWLFYLLGPPILVYGVFVLPVSLRKDHVYHCTYHIPLIPHYLLVLGGAIFAIVDAYTELKADAAKEPECIRKMRMTAMKERLHTLLRDVLCGSVAVQDVDVAALRSHSDFIGGSLKGRRGGSVLEMEMPILLLSPPADTETAETQAGG